MSILQAVILGIIQGVTEFLPVSSTGQVTFFGNLMKLETAPDLLFLIILHIGTFTGVFFAFRKSIARTFVSLFHVISDLFYNLKTALSGGSEKQYRKAAAGPSRKLAVMICVSMIPTVIIGFILSLLAETLSWNLLCSGIGLFVTALLLFVGSFSVDNSKTAKDAKYIDAVLVGAFQGFSGFPGISRFAVTYSSGMLGGFGSKFAKKYSFLLVIPTVAAAYIFEAIKRHSFISTTVAAMPTLAAFLAAAVTGFFVGRIVLTFVTRRSMKYFAIYCVVIGALSMVLYLF